MAKIKLGNRPKNFKKEVSFQLHEGDEGRIECLFKYRTRTEFGAFIDELAEKAGMKIKGEDVKFSLKALMEKTKESNADYIMQIMDGWNLDEPFSRESIAQLCNELPGAASVIMEDYRAAIAEGRLGN